MTHRTSAVHRPTRIGRRLGAGATIAALALGGVAVTATPAMAAEPDFGPNVIILDPSMSTDQINSIFAGIDNETEFSQNRHAVFFKPGVYGSAAGQNDPATATGIVNGQVGYYTAVAGLGASPDDVLINGAIHAEGRPPATTCPWDGGGEADTALTNFWRSLSNVAINPIQQPVEGDTGVYGVCYPTPENPAGIMLPEGTADAHQLRWAVSQAAPMRRVHVQGDLTLMPRFGGYSSGGYLADSVIDGTVVSGSQQQWYTRDSEVGTWNGGVWNMVFSGVVNAPATDFGPKADGTTGTKTTLATTPVSRPAPFLYLEGDEYRVFVPNVRTESAGVDWSTDASAGESISIDDFYIAHEGTDTADTINAALASGKNLLLTPGVYDLDEPITVDRAGTVVLGLGYASLTPTAGNTALEVGDVSGVKIAGITVDAGVVESDLLVKVGPTDASESDASDPTTLSDVFIRVGGPWAGNAVTSIEVNSDGVLLDHIWAWRGDHGLDGSGTWTGSTGDHGLIVNGDDVTATGLFVEHYQKNQVIWNGEGGTTVFFQSEIPYEVPSAAAWMDGDRVGYAAYKVADDVTTHSAVGLGAYSYFNQGVDIRLASAFQAPKSRQVTFQSMTSVFLNGSGGIDHVINDAGAATVNANGLRTPQFVSYPPADVAAPTVSVTSTPAAPAADGWYHSEVELTLSATDDFTPPAAIEVDVDGSGWQAASDSLVVGDGVHSVLVRATDDSGNVSEVVSWSGSVDTGAPLVTASVVGGRVVVKATDAGAGVASIEVTTSAKPTAASTKWVAYDGPVAVKSGKSLAYRATDELGNVSAIGTITMPKN